MVRACRARVGVPLLAHPCAWHHGQPRLTHVLLCAVPDLEWRVTYVGSAESDQHDQELECVLVGPVPVGMNKFVLHTEAPKPDNIPIEDLLGVTVVLITCSYKSREFIRVGCVRAV